MKTLIRVKNIDLTDSISSLVESKIANISKLFDGKMQELAEARVEVGKPSMHHKTGFVYYAEINLKIGRKLYRAVAEHADIRTAIDLVRDEIENQIKKEKNKKIDLSRKPRRV